MPRLNPYDRAAVDALVQRSGQVVRHADLVALGMPKSTITHHTSAKGRWQRLLPGVVLAHRGTATLAERRRGALVYAGRGARISGHHALDLHGALGPEADVGTEILLIVPNHHHRTSSRFCVVERSERNPGTTVRQGFPVTAIPRAGGDACRRQDMTLDDVRELLSRLLREDLCTLKQLQRAVLSGPTQRSGHARGALLELGGGVRSAAEARGFRLIETSGLPQPLWNQAVVVDGEWIGEADAYWPGLGVVLEIDSMTWHLGARALRRTQAKARRYAAAGLLLVSVAPADLLADPQGFLSTLRQTLTTAAARLAP